MLCFARLTLTRVHCLCLFPFIIFKLKKDNLQGWENVCFLHSICTFNHCQTKVKLTVFLGLFTCCGFFLQQSWDLMNIYCNSLSRLETVRTICVEIFKLFFLCQFSLFCCCQTKPDSIYMKVVQVADVTRIFIIWRVKYKALAFKAIKLKFFRLYFINEEFCNHFLRV